jgi:hypothetical protein
LQSGGPTFITLINTDVINISPALLDVGSFEVTVVLSDGKLQNTYPLGITITNTAPIFTSNPIDQVVYQGISISYTWPAITDAEKQSVQISISPNTSWYSESLTTLTISPTKTETLPSYPVTVTLSDTFSSTSYPMIITVKANQPPSFVAALTNQFGNEGIKWTYQLPEIDDPEK